METIVYVLMLLLRIYIVLGLAFAFAFLTKGINKVDEGAIGASTGFRIIVLPGIILLWPVLLKKWLHIIKKEHR